MNGTDKARAALEAAIEGMAPDYVAPALTSLLVKKAGEIGLSKQLVLETVATGFDMAEAFGGSNNG